MTFNERKNLNMVLLQVKEESDIMPGSHGSLTKAGKVRSQTPKVVGKRHLKEIPRIRNKKHYIHRIVEGNEVGQFKERRRRR